jgi:ABC-type transport system involved in multi-copper enzyme maturation permease subunit
VFAIGLVPHWRHFDSLAGEQHKSLQLGLRLLAKAIANAKGKFFQAQHDKRSCPSLHTFLLVLIALVAPALTADCIAREKRDGTLGLLFMTPLSAGGIVAGKALAQGLRAFTLWLAVLPILAIPFMTGGLTWFDAFSALSLEFCATVLCLAAGLLASSLAQGRNAAFLLAFLFGACFLFLFSQLFVFILFGMWRTLSFLNYQGFGSIMVETEPFLFSPDFQMSRVWGMELLDRGDPFPCSQIGRGFVWQSARSAAVLLCGGPVRGGGSNAPGRTKFPLPARELAAALLHAVVPPAVPTQNAKNSWIGTPSPGCNNIPGKPA